MHHESEFLQNAYDASIETGLRPIRIDVSDGIRRQYGKIYLTRTYRDRGIGLDLWEFLNLYITPDMTSKEISEVVQLGIEQIGVNGMGAAVGFRDSDLMEITFRKEDGVMYRFFITVEKGSNGKFFKARVTEVNSWRKETDTAIEFGSGLEVKLLERCESRVEAEFKSLDSVRRLKKYAGNLIAREDVFIYYNGELLSVNREELSSCAVPGLEGELKLMRSNDDFSGVEKTFFVCDLYKLLKYVPKYIRDAVDVSNFIFVLPDDLLLRRDRRWFRYSDRIQRYAAYLIYMEFLSLDKSIDVLSTSYLSDMELLTRDVLGDAQNFNDRNLEGVDFLRYVGDNDLLVKFLTAIKNPNMGRSRRDLKMALLRGEFVNDDSSEIKRAVAILRDRENQGINARSVSYMEEPYLRMFKVFFDRLYEETGVGFESNFFYYDESPVLAKYYPVINEQGVIVWRALWNVNAMRRKIKKIIETKDFRGLMRFVANDYSHEVGHAEESMEGFNKALELIRRARESLLDDPVKLAKLRDAEMLIKKYYVSLFNVTPTSVKIKSVGDKNLLRALSELLQDVDALLYEDVFNVVVTVDEFGRMSQNFGMQHVWTHQSSETEEFSLKYRMIHIYLGLIRGFDFVFENLSTVFDDTEREYKHKYDLLRQGGMLELFVEFFRDTTLRLFSQDEIFVNAQSFRALENSL